MADQVAEKPEAPAPAVEGQEAPAPEPKKEQSVNPDESSQKEDPATETKSEKAELNGKEESRAEGMSPYRGGSRVAR